MSDKLIVAADLRREYHMGEELVRAVRGAPKVLSEIGFAMGDPAAAARAITQKPTPTWSTMQLPGGASALMSSGGQRPVLLPQSMESGPVQAQPVLDPDTKKPIPGFIATPSPGGKGMTVHLNKAPADISPTAALNMLKMLPELEATQPGITTNFAPVLTKRLSALVNGSQPEKASASATGAADPQSKVQRANSLRKAHPEWSRAMIIDAVNQGEE